MSTDPIVSPASFDGLDAWDEFELGWHDVGDLLGLGLHGLRSTRHFLGRDAVGLSLAIQCADRKAQDVAKAEMLLWKRAGRGWSMVGHDQHPVAMMLMTRPNDVHSWTDFWRMTIMHLELAQNAYVYKRMARDGTVQELIPILPARCRARVSPVTGALFYEIFTGTDYERALLGTSYMVVPAAQMIHFRGRLWDGLYGLSSIALGSPIFDLVSAISEYQTNLFGNDGKQPIVFEMDQAFPVGDVADAAFQRLKRQLGERTRKASATGDPLLLEAGLKAKTIALNARDATTTESFNQQVMRICGLMNMPPHKIFALEAVAYNNMSAMNEQYYADCLQPTTRSVQETLRNGLFPVTDWPVYSPRFDEITLQSTSLAGLSALIDMAMRNSLMEIDEARQIIPFAFNPLPNGAGQRRLLPVAMAMVDRKGDVVSQGAGGQPNNTGKPPGAPPPSDPDADDPDADDGKRLRLAVNNG